MNITEQMEIVQKTVVEILHENDLGLGSCIWRIHTACVNCPEQDDHCGIDCKRKGYYYLQKVKIAKIEFALELDGESQQSKPRLTFTDDDDLTFDISDIDRTIFTVREDALTKLYRMDKAKENGNKERG